MTARREGVTLARCAGPRRWGRAASRGCGSICGERREVVLRTVAAQRDWASALLDADGHVAAHSGVMATPTVVGIGRIPGRVMGRRPWVEAEGRALPGEVRAAPAGRP